MNFTTKTEIMQYIDFNLNFTPQKVFKKKLYPQYLQGKLKIENLLE